MVKFLRNKAIDLAPSLHHEHSFYKWWVLISVMIGTFMAVLDTTIVNVALSKMTAAFGTSVDKIEWVLTAYLLIFAVVLPSSGWIADHLGYKKTYFFGMLLFTLGSLLCSLSWDENALIFFRVVQGAGAGFVMPVGMAIVTREFPPEQRGTALGFWGIASAASVSLGPLVGGYLIDTFSWHAIFDVNVPVGIVGLISILIIQREFKTEKTRNFDFIGFISMTIFLTSLLLALSDGNASWNTGGWTSPFILSCFFISAISLIVFMVTELNVKHPIVDLTLFKNRNFASANLILFVFGIGFFGSTFLLPLYLQNSLGYTAFQAGLVFLPLGIVQAFVSPIAGRLTDKINPKLMIMIGVILLAWSLYAYGFFSLQTEKAAIQIPLIIRAAALGMIFVPLSTVALLTIPKQKIAQASGLFNTIRQIGGSFGVALLGSLLTRRTIFHMQAFSQTVDANSPVFQNTLAHAKNFVMHSVGGSPQEVTARAKSLIMLNISSQSFIQGINDDFLVAALLSIVLVIPILFLKIKRSNSTEKIQSLE
ncbi:MAG TPA: DHA2 family efflux MFS transporter permease subunit [Ignavibacteriaceae bacterium]|nr:DHA2 family efflux MFS transporter permease subunit [Ignavibacteriaceae bacterium]